MGTPSKSKKFKSGGGKTPKSGGVKVKDKRGKKFRWDEEASDSEKRDADASSDEDNESRGS